MATQEHYNPFNEEGQEEDKRLFSNDKKHSFTPIEETPDDQPVLEEATDQRPASVSELEIADHSKIEELKEELARTIGFHQGDGAASVGPDILEDVHEAEELQVDRTVPAISSEKADRADDEAIPREKVSVITAEPKKWTAHRYKDGRKREENLKTLTPSKKERNSRGWLSRLFQGEEKAD